ncbi:MAG TPA: molybdopterin biosynthesis protein [Acetobacteraceae bacterium]|nr:molybdopterin biosynthesis protein [Acetobacteraceae bacterium]
MSAAGTDAELLRAARQEQFLEVIDREEAARRFQRHLRLAPLGEERVPLAAARGRVLARDLLAAVDVPGFDRASVDGFAVRAADTEGASPATPSELRLLPGLLTPGVVWRQPVQRGEAAVIATGGMVPRGADAVVMVEHTEASGSGAPVVAVRRACVPGQGIAAAGSDIARGETVLRRGRRLTAREIGMLAATGFAEVPVWRRPRVAIVSTGDELVPPGAAIRPGQVYDSNAAILAASVEEAGGEPVPLGIVPDQEAALAAAFDRALAAGDVVLLSGGTSKGAGDIAYRVAASRLRDPGVVVHGVALKPGKPLCLAVDCGKPVAILPGFPSSAIFTFHEFIAPVIRAFAGRLEAEAETVPATLAVRTPSERGRTEYLMVSLVRDAAGGLAAYPTAKGSGAVTAFSQADGFVRVAALTEAVPAGSPVTVTLIDAESRPADLVIIGSHCVGLDMLVGRMEQEGIGVKALNVGSSGGLLAARRGECDIAPIHLMDPETGEYNRPLLDETLTLLPGYGRMQGVVVAADDPRFAGCSSATEAVAVALADPEALMIGRNAGSGTRVLIDRLLAGARPPGYANQAKSHNAVAAAVAQGRADWGIAIETVARQYGLGFLPLQAEQYDFAVPLARRDRAAVNRFAAVLAEPATRAALRDLGFDAPDPAGG